MTIFPTQIEMKKKFGKVFTTEQTASLVDTIDVLQQAEIERTADIRDIKQGQEKLTTEVATLNVNQKKLIAGQEKLTTEVATLNVNQKKLIAGQEKLTTEVATINVNQKKLIAGQEKLTTEVATINVNQKKLIAGQEKLIIAQQHTDERLDKIDERFRKVDERFDKIDERIDNLTTEVRTGFKELRQAIGGLGNSFGFDLEEFVSALLPPYLESYNITDMTLKRHYFEAKDGGQAIEVDLVSNGQHDGQPVLILAECKTTIGGGEMRRIAKKLNSVASEITDREVIKIVVAMNLHPTGDVAARETGIWTIPYSDINRHNRVWHK